MPGMYPENLVNSQEKLDHFWNLRIGIMVAVLSAFIVIMLLNNYSVTLSVVMSLSSYFLSVLVVYCSNIPARLMTKLVGPYNSD